MSKKLAFCLAAVAFALAGCKSTPDVDSSVTSVSEEGGIRFTRITDDNDAVAVTDVPVQGNRRIPVVQKVFDRDGHITDPDIEKIVRRTATNLLDYVKQTICPAVTLERLMREGQRPDPELVTA